MVGSNELGSVIQTFFALGLLLAIYIATNILELYGVLN